MPATMRHSQSRTRCRLAPLLLLLATINIAESRSLFGGRVTAAALFGKSNTDDKKEDGEVPIPPLPPPPPRPPLPQTGTASTNPPPPPPKPDAIATPKPEEEKPEEESFSVEDLTEAPASPTTTEWPSAPLEESNPQTPQEQTGWQQAQPQPDANPHWGTNTQYVQHQQHSYYDDPYHQQQWPSLEQQLADSSAREHELVGTVQNLSDTIHTMQNLDQLHSRQMDVLTERIMSAEAQIALEHNVALEHLANCTELGRDISNLHQELSDWQTRCATFADQAGKNDHKIKELKRHLQEARAEAENLAISIENSRIRDQMAPKSKKPRGLVGWMLSFVFSSSDPQEDLDDALPTPRELAKSTLLRALQLERSSVDELESIVAMLQQNNSAIAEVVKSRDMIIDELNDRVAVFEEDKVVLKAALKQLQKEMKEEAPRTEKLMDELEAARRENARLVNEIEALVEMHQNEITNLQQSIHEAQYAANSSESNLTAIGQYVDTLEQRLASFAIVRREVEVREQKCKEMEEHALRAEEERDNLRAKIEEFEVEQSDLKSLFEELVQEQTTMRQENSMLTQERDSLTQGAQRSREALASLENNMKKRDQEITEWQSQALGLEQELNSTREQAAEMQNGLQAAQAGGDQLHQQIESFQSRSEELQAQLEAKVVELETAKQELEAKALALEQKDESMASSAAKLSESQKEMLDLLVKLEQRENELETQGAQLAELQALAKSKEQSVKLTPEAAPQEKAMMNASIIEEQAPEMNATSIQRRTDQNRTSVPQRTLTGKPPPLSLKPAPKPSSQTRKVPFRQVRKLFAKATGVHGAFTKPSEKGVFKPPPSKPGPQRPTPKAPQAKSVPPNGVPPPGKPQPPPPAAKRTFGAPPEK